MYMLQITLWRHHSLSPDCKQRLCSLAGPDTQEWLSFHPFIQPSPCMAITLLLRNLAIGFLGISSSFFLLEKEGLNKLFYTQTNLTAC